MVDPEQTLPQSIGRYQVVRELGKGAMGRVLLAHDPVLERHVAIKHLRADLNIAPEQKAPLLERMRQEARASARISHPNLIVLHDMGEAQEVELYLVFEYVAGPTLKERLSRGPLGASEAARLAKQLGRALSYAHRAGIVHRDVKPENVILAETGAKVADFGIARVPDSTLTLGGGVLGTPAYSAPEALRGSKFSPRSDQFSMAATLYEAISGHRAFPGDDAMAVASLITTDEPPPIAALCNLPVQVDVVLARALSKHPKSRFDDCGRFGHALAEALDGNPRAPMPTVPDFYHQPRSRVPTLLMGASAGLLCAAGTWFALQTFQTPLGGTQSAGRERATPFDEEDPAAVAWLRESPARKTRDPAGADPSEDDERPARPDVPAAPSTDKANR